jgi:hypothetical protein
MEAGPFKIDETTESIIRKSDLPRRAGFFGRLKEMITGS